jgi:hypothetical protein
MITEEDLERLRAMAKLPEGRKPLPQEWFVDRANAILNIKPFDDEERQRAKEKEEKNRDGKQQ